MSDLTPTLLERIEAILGSHDFSWGFEIEDAAREVRDFVIETYGPPF